MTSLLQGPINLESKLEAYAARPIELFKVYNKVTAGTYIVYSLGGPMKTNSLDPAVDQPVG